jgi:hypothetical protein
MVWALSLVREDASDTGPFTRVVGMGESLKPPP